MVQQQPARVVDDVAARREVTRREMIARESGIATLHQIEHGQPMRILGFIGRCVLAKLVEQTFMACHRGAGS